MTEIRGATHSKRPLDFQRLFQQPVNRRSCAEFILDMARMISSKLFSALKPSSLDRRASNRVGQPLTIAQIVSSGSSRISFTAFDPAMRSSASICSRL